MTLNAPIFAIASAFLFGISPPLAKWVAGEISPFLLAGLLYTGSGLGLHLFLAIKRQRVLPEILSLTPKQKLNLLGTILFGGILAPLCLAYGLLHTSGTEVSLLLNLETVMTTLIAAFLFHEHVSLRVWSGKGLLILGAIFLTLQTDGSGIHFSLPGLAILLACLFWGLDNNLTRELESVPPTALATIKGWTAGLFNTALAFFLSQTLPSLPQTFTLLTLGAFSYGLSLVFFIESLRRIGSSRTSTYFSSGPFFGVVLSIVLLGENPTFQIWTATFLMLLGLVILYWEKHGHPHKHEAITHSHLHSHFGSQDDHHHNHQHDALFADNTPHSHEHTHAELEHAHPHLPDTHHRHRH